MRSCASCSPRRRRARPWPTSPTVERLRPDRSTRRRPGLPRPDGRDRRPHPLVGRARPAPPDAVPDLLRRRGPLARVRRHRGGHRPTAAVGHHAVRRRCQGWGSPRPRGRGARGREAVDPGAGRGPARCAGGAARHRRDGGARRPGTRSHPGDDAGRCRRSPTARRPGSRSPAATAAATSSWPSCATPAAAKVRSSAGGCASRATPARGRRCSASCRTSSRSC